MIKRLVGRALRPFGINLFPRRFENPLMQEGIGDQELFDAIFETNYWKSEGTKSGFGSEEHFARSYRDRLDSLLRVRKLYHIFDAPCGDVSWMSVMVSNNSQFRYTGADISPRLLASARQRFPDFDLRLLDITKDSFPLADVWHCRDCLFHLPFLSIKNALINYVNSGIPYALITSHRSRLFHRNLDVTTGGFRILDFELEPFSFDSPECRLQDYRIGFDFPRYVCLWPRRSIVRAIDKMHV